jgi:hypothetical protein
MQAFSIKLPKNVIRSLKAGLKKHRAGFSGDGLTAKTITSAQHGIKNGRWPKDKIVKASAWFARHNDNFEQAKNANTPMVTAWQLWGGGYGGRDWIDAQAKKIKAKKNKVNQMKRNKGQELANPTLTSEQRRALPNRAFGFITKSGERKYPLMYPNAKGVPEWSEGHAIDAIRRVRQHGSPSVKKSVYTKIARHFPELAKRSEVLSEWKRNPTKKIHKKEVTREAVDPGKQYTLWDRGQSGYWSIDRSYGGAHIKFDDAYWTYLDERKRSSRPAAFFEKGIDPNQRPNPAPTHKETFVRLGDKVIIELEDGHEHAMGREYVLATDENMSDIYLVKKGKRARLSEAKTPKSEDVIAAWTAGGKAVSANEISLPNPHGAKKLGNIVSIKYSGPLAGRPDKLYIHEFKKPYPALTQSLDGSIISRQNSNYTVTRRGIVG